MIPDNFLQIIIRLALSVLLGGVIGIERAGANHDAGIRTHVLVCLGSAGIMLMSEQMTIQYNCDIGRFGAQVVSGIGFLGAGCILINGNRIKGLTTAAGLWTTACVGLAVGIGYYFISILVSVMMMIAMLTLRPLSGMIQKREMMHDYTLRICLENGDNFKDISEYVYDNGQKVLLISNESEGVFIIKIANCTEDQINRLVWLLMQNEKVNKVERLK